MTRTAPAGRTLRFITALSARLTCPKPNARPIRHNARVPDRNGKIFYTSITSLSHISKWFGIIEAREKYILDSVGKDFFCAIEKDKVVGFLYLKKTGKDTVELAVMGVLKEYHRKGIGRALFEYAKESIQESGYSFIQVKTVKMGMYEDYDCTNRFYISLGFKEFEVLNSLWDENNPCQIYVMGI